MIRASQIISAAIIGLSLILSACILKGWSAHPEVVAAFISGICYMVGSIVAALIALAAALAFRSNRKEGDV